MADVAALVARALQLHQAGRLDQAEISYRQILAQQPENSQALHGLGMLACEAGRIEAGAELFRRASLASPNNAEIHNHLGQALVEMGRFGEAIEYLERAAQLKPNLVEAYINLGDAWRAAGKAEPALAAYEKAIALQPAHVIAMNNLGVMLKEMGRSDEARAAFEKVVQLDPALPQGHSNLAGTLTDKAAAIAEFRKAITLKPDDAEAHNHLGALLEETGQLTQASGEYRQAIALKGDYATAYSNLANALQKLGRVDEAAEAHRTAIAIAPDSAQSWCNLGNLLKDHARIDEAIEALRKSIEVAPRTSLKDKQAAFHSNLLLCLHYHPRYTPDEIFREHLKWNEMHAKPLAREIRQHSNDRAAGRRLRIGYVSADFCRHPVNYFLEPILGSHDHAAFEVFCYADEIWPDAVTDRLRKKADQWRNIRSMSDEVVAETVRRDGIDILIDLGGHTGYNRLLTFARRPAPVQASYLGYPDTTGMSAIDYRITDAHADPIGMTEAIHSEKLVRLAGNAWCYLPPEASPEVAPPPVVRAGHVTFGSFNILPKITEDVIGTWSRILLAAPGSRLLLKNKSLADAATAERVRQLFVSQGVDAERLEFRASDPSHADHLRSYAHMDIALDPFPYHGTTSTCETLWMGVPLVTLAGRTHVGRVGVSLLSNLGLQDWIGQTQEDYVRIAAELARDTENLIQQRKTLRERFRASALCDGVRLTRELESAYRAMWGRWCKQ